MKVILLINFFLFSSIISFSQNSFTIGPEISFGNNSFKNDGGIGLGGSIEFTFKSSVTNAVRFYSGYDHFHYYKKQYQNSGFLPVRIGYGYFLNNNRRNIFADAGVGKFFNTNYSTVLSF